MEKQTDTQTDMLRRDFSTNK